MRFSHVLKSSPHCLPSPDGRLIAILLPSGINLKAVESLDVVRNINLPADLLGSVTTFVWSPSAERILLASIDEVHVVSATESQFHATIRNPSSSIAKSAFVDFGATDQEAFVFSAHGIKLSIFNLSSSKAVEISNPKFYTASSATRGFSFRPHTHHLALITRASGKDTISIHSPESREVQRSWSPDIIDAQGLAWTPDGRWLAVWESAAQGHRVVFFTPDGHKYKDWLTGHLRHAQEDMDYRLGAGVKLVVFSPDSQHVAIGDYSRCVSLLHTSTMGEHKQLLHPPSIEPKDTLQIWQEQSSVSKANIVSPTFVRASLPVSPPGRTTNSTQELKSGCLVAQFDSSSALLAVILEDAPSTLWIWDVAAMELRAVLMFHSDITRVDWHPVQPELLLVKCEGDGYRGIGFVWDPVSNGPQSIDFRSLLPGAKISGKPSMLWLKSSVEPASLFFADSQACILCSLADTDEEVLPWQNAQSTASVNQDKAAEALLNLKSSSAEESDIQDGDMEDMSELDDTFHFKKFVGE